MTIDDLYIVNYCHSSCTPLLNIMRLPKDEAFALAYKMAGQNKALGNGQAIIRTICRTWR